MKSINKLNKAFENRIRLGIMSVMIAIEWIEFNELKEKLQVTDGNLSSHMNTLIKQKYVKVKKRFKNNKPNTSYRITEKGKDAFIEHLNFLEEIVKQAKQ